MDKNLNDEYKHVIQMNKSIKSQKLQTSDQSNSQRYRERSTTKENIPRDFRPQNYRSKSKEKNYTINKDKQKQKEKSNYNHIDNDP
jgi:hypothetical protein